MIVIDHVLACLLAFDANVTLSHYSTTGLQSLIVGTPHVYVSTPAVPSWDNIASASHLIETVTEYEQLKAAIARTKYRFNRSELTRAGIPRNAVARMLQQLEG